MIGLLGGERDAGHEGEGLAEVAEGEARAMPPALLVETPAGSSASAARVPILPGCSLGPPCWRDPRFGFMSAAMSERQTFAPDAAAIERLADEA
jgi:hypothetical protein